MKFMVSFEMDSGYISTKMDMKKFKSEKMDFIKKCVKKYSSA